jgi:hypothetical protein
VHSLMPSPLRRNSTGKLMGERETGLTISVLEVNVCTKKSFTTSTNACRLGLTHREKTRKALKGSIVVFHSARITRCNCEAEQCGILTSATRKKGRVIPLHRNVTIIDNVPIVLTDAVAGVALDVSKA